MELDQASSRLERLSAFLEADPDNPALLSDCAQAALEADETAQAAILFKRLDAVEPLDAGALEAWLERLLMLCGADILRLKGVLSVEGEPRRVIVQSVHMMYEGDYGAPWGDAPKVSRLVVIGRNLDQTEIREGFLSCRVQIPA